MALVPALVLKAGLPQVAGAGDTISTAVSSVSTYAMTAAAALVKGNAVYSSSSTAALAKGDASATSRCIGLVADATIANAASGNIATSGPLTIADWTAITGALPLVAGAPYFVSDATAGLLTVTAPTASGHFTHQIGYALTTTTMMIEVSPTVWAIP